MEESEYNRITKLYLDVVYRTALNCCKNPYDAEDVVQNTFMKLLEYQQTFQDDEHIRKWLIRVAVNESHSLWRSFWKRKITPLDEITAAPEFSIPENSELFYAVQKLPPRYRETIHLYYYEGYSVREISDLLRISEGAIRTRLMRARSKLKQELKGAWK